MWHMDEKQTIECGRYSGFGWCCIFWFLLVWLPAFTHWNEPNYKKSFTYRYNKLIYKMAARRKLKYPFEFGGKPYWVEGFGRIPCPFCLFFSRNVGHINCSKTEGCKAHRGEL